MTTRAPFRPFGPGTLAKLLAAFAVLATVVAGALVPATTTAAGVTFAPICHGGGGDPRPVRPAPDDHGSCCDACLLAGATLPPTPPAVPVRVARTTGPARPIRPTTPPARRLRAPHQAQAPPLAA